MYRKPVLVPVLVVFIVNTTNYAAGEYPSIFTRRGWYKKWRENGWLSPREEPV
jgi:hypothetical protein